MEIRKNPNCNPHKKQFKGSDFETQIQTVYSYLIDHTATATMVSEATGIPQKNICRYKRHLERVNDLAVLFYATCQITGFKAGYLTCNPLLIQTIKSHEKVY